MITGAQSLIQGLKKHGVELIFGYPGGAILPVYHELAQSSIRHILTRSEQGAAHAASAYSRVSGQVGVCMATSGPGATNLVSGIANAFLDSTPLIAITGQVATSLVGSDAFQEVDITGITHPITKHNYLVTDAEDIAKIVDEAFYLAKSGRPGPVLIDIPANVAKAPCSGKAPAALDLPGYKPTLKGHKLQIKNACEALMKAEKPLLYVGGGVISARAFSELTDLAERLCAGVVTTLMGKGVFPVEHPLFLGMPGIHGHPAANLALTEADVVLALGARFDERVTARADHFVQKATIIHVDVDPAEIGKNVGSHIPIVGDCAAVMRDMLALLPAPRLGEPWQGELAALRRRNGFMCDRAVGTPLNGRYVLSLLSNLLGDTAILTTDVGQHQMTAAQYFRGGYGGRFLSSGGLGCMGYGLPAAMGAQFAAPSATVVCVCGDGGLQMSLNEMATIIANRLPIKILLLNNGVLGMVRQLEHFNYNVRSDYYAIDLPGNPDFCKLAEAYGFASLHVERAEQVEPALKEALANGRPTLIECVTDAHDMVLPMVKAGGALAEMMFEY